jgi:opacity protein-like surface antigen
MKTKGLFALLMLVTLSFSSIAQETENGQSLSVDKRFGFELSGGASFATRKLADAKPNPGLGFEGIFSYRFMPHTGVYAGWGWNRFGADKSFAGSDVCFEETGYVFGLQFSHPIGNSPTSVNLRVGALYNHIEIENAEGDIIEDTGHGLGWQVAGGIEIPLGSNWILTPGVKFNALNREVDQVGTTYDLNLNYLSVRVGFTKKF